MWYGRFSKVGYFKIVGSKCSIKRDDDSLGNFESRCDEGIFLGYSAHNKAYTCFNKRLKRVVESTKVKVDEMLQPCEQQKEDNEEVHPLEKKVKPEEEEKDQENTLE